MFRKRYSINVIDFLQEKCNGIIGDEVLIQNENILKFNYKKFDKNASNSVNIFNIAYKYIYSQEVKAYIELKAKEEKKEGE